MSRRNHNATNVPHYAPADTPRIDLSPHAGVDHPEAYEEHKETLADLHSLGRSKMRVNDLLRSLWQSGDRFCLTMTLDDTTNMPKNRYGYPQLPAIPAVALVMTGSYVGRKQAGHYVQVDVKLDGSQKRKTGARFGAATFVKAVNMTRRDISWLSRSTT